jgi:hypothetical protein
MPGPYGLLPAPESVLKERFSQLGLPRYPVRDAEHPALAVDPFAPENRIRFPATVVDDHLSDAEDMFRQVDIQLPGEVMSRVFHLRNNIKSSQVLEWHWENIDGAAFQLGSRSPVESNGGASDGTVPFWSARLADTPDAQVYNLRTDTDHGDLAEDPETLEVLNRLVQGKDLPAEGTVSVGPSVPSATEDEIKALVTEIQSGNVTESDLDAMPESKKRGLAKYLGLC